MYYAACCSSINGYKIMDNRAFTKENFFISTINIYCGPHFTSSILTNHFQKYGKILEVRLMEERYDLKAVYICIFAQPESAARALLEENNSCCGYKGSFIVSPSDSLWQPNCQQFLENLKVLQNSTSCKTNQKKASILNLCDDSLEFVCKLLQLNDQINFGLSCLRIWDVFAMASRVEYKSLHSDILAKMTPFKMRLFLEVTGPQIKSLSVNTYNIPFRYLRPMLELMNRFCVNVKKLQVINVFDRKDQLITLLDGMRLLEELELNSIQFQDNIIENLKLLKNLKYLSITARDNKTVENIDALWHLEKLTLKRCSNLDSYCLSNICKNLKHLNYLEIKYCWSLKVEDFKYPPQHLLSLETLKLKGNGLILSCPTQLPKLRALEIEDFSVRMSEEFYYNLAKFNQLEDLKLCIETINNAKVSSIAELKNLKVFYIRSNNLNTEFLAKFSHLADLEEVVFSGGYITEEGILLILKKCRKLKSLTLEHCRGITSDVVNAAQAVLKQQQRSCTFKEDSFSRFSSCITLNISNDNDYYICCKR